jgi:hypothetical protein
MGIRRMRGLCIFRTGYSAFRDEDIWRLRVGELVQGETEMSAAHEMRISVGDGNVI